MDNQQNTDWALASAADLRLDLYEPQRLLFEEPVVAANDRSQSAWRATELRGSVKNHLAIALKRSLGSGRNLVIADKAGSGKSVLSLRVQALLSDPEACKHIFHDQKTRLVVHWPSFGLPNPGVSHPTLFQMLMADPGLNQFYPKEKEQDRRDAVSYASRHRRLVIIMDGYDELTDDPNSFNRRELIESLYRDSVSSGTLPVCWVFTGRSYAIDEAYQFNRLFQSDRFLRFSIVEFDDDTQDRYMKRALSKLPAMKNVRWRDSIENQDTDWKDLLGLPYTLREIARAFEVAAPNTPKWTSPSDMFCQTSRSMLERELVKPGNQKQLRESKIKDIKEAIKQAERALGAVAIEMATRGIKKEVLANNLNDQEPLVRKIFKQAGRRFSASCLQENYEETDAKRFWEWAKEFVGNFMSHRGSTQGFYTTKSLGFNSQKIQEMWAARYLTTYASNSDLRPTTGFPTSILACLGDPSWVNIWVCAIRIPILCEIKEHGVQEDSYMRALKVLFERPINISYRRPTELMWAAEQWLLSKPSLRHIVDDLHKYLAAQFQEIMQKPHYELAIKELLDPARYVLLRCGDEPVLDEDTGGFMMGPDDWGNNSAVEVTLTQRFGVSKYQLTRKQYSVWENLADKEASNLPVSNISWFDCYFFLVGLRGERIKLPDGREYRFSFPTNAQWEYACRAGSTTKYCYGDDEKELTKYAWYEKNSNGRPHPVGKKKPNAWDLYDMHGNVWEWCFDWYDPYPLGPLVDPVGPADGSYRVNRGGSWYNVACGCGSAYRYGRAPNRRHDILGFRLVLSSSGIPKSPESEQEEADDSLGN